MGFLDIFKRNTNTNKYNESFFKLLGINWTAYDNNAPTYIEEGFNINPIVYAVISQMATKTSSVPFKIKKIESKQTKAKIDNLLKATGYNLSAQQYGKKMLLEKKAYSSDDIEMPLERPNPLQTWAEFLELYKTFMKLTGNAYIYKLRVAEGRNAGEILGLYLLPSHLMNIVLKPNADLMSIESPIGGYKLISGETGIEFTHDEVTHIKYPNPNYDTNGSHLYGFSPIRALLKNVQSSNTALDLNIKTMNNGGAFGFVHSKGPTPFTDAQAKGIKGMMKDAFNDKDKLSQIMGVSSEIGFTRIGMTTDELKLFDYLNFDQKQICNALGWSDKLLNNDAGAKYDNVNSYRKQVVIDNIIPDLNLFTEAFNDDILTGFKGYDKTCVVFEYSELPEMQQDMTQMIAWIRPSIEIGLMSREESRTFMKLPNTDNESMKEFTVNADIMTLEQSLDDFPNVVPNDQAI